MAERHAASLERTKTESLEAAVAERSAELRKGSIEHRDKKHAEQAAEKARAEATKEALHSKEYEVRHSTEKERHYKDYTGLTGKRQSYIQTMHHIQSSMTPLQKTVSRIIHNPAIEKISDVASTTVARPSALVFGGLFAFLGVLAVYSYARYIGFALSGSETMLAFTTGWLFGILLDFLRLLFWRRS